MSGGRVALVGAGPGDPGLLTLRGRECLEEADLVLHDSLVDPRILRLARPGAEVVSVGKRGGAGDRDAEQAAIHERMLAAARAGRVVVRLKGGDPFVFGRGGEEAEVLVEAGIPFEVVPGITSAVAVPAYAGIPVTQRGLASAVVVVTGHEAPGAASSPDWAALARVDTLVVLMARKRLAEVVGKLLGAGRPAAEPAALVHRGTTNAQRVVVATLAELPDEVERAGIGTPSLLVVGEVVRLRERLSWFERRPLLGRRIVVTRPREQSARLVSRLERLGAVTLEAPAIEVEAIDPPAALDAALAELDRYEWIVFTSRNGVRVFLDRLLAVGRDLRALGRASIAVIGRATAEALEERGLRPDLVPAEFVAESLAAELGPRVSGRRVLLPRAERARDVLPRSLRAAGAEVVEVPTYRSVRPRGLPGDVLAALAEGTVDAVTFTSSSTADGFLALLDADGRAALRRTRLVSIGPVTSETLRGHGFPPAIEARRFDVEGLAEALVDSLGGGR